MSGKTVTFYFSVLSPWVYFGGPRFHEIARDTNATVVYRPIDLLRVFRETGGTPLAAMSPARQAFRARERERWSAWLNMPVNAKPAHHPVDESLAAQLLMAAEDAHGGAVVWPLAQRMLAGVWVHDLDISKEATLAQIAREQGLDADALLALAATPAMRARFNANTTEAMAAGVFGVPSFVVDGDLHFGQDRLDFVERALRAD
ncbi:2-hydroxychromene-2-carboxylate isomerase [Hydrogenophaga sp. 2FB]|uniref:2-hydroxychromene-2-carboxylate isomerase n=1 Tax=Hydrogenophaga sp. 2FB TaxID=2502187 RepID=UPI0010F6BFF5|nr:2-hydroxychromene-2-carboxylate isomerase [Hydrogenophaga sp. 2FB]